MQKYSSCPPSTQRKYENYTAYHSIGDIHCSGGSAAKYQMNKTLISGNAISFISNLVLQNDKMIEL